MHMNAPGLLKFTLILVLVVTCSLLVQMGQQRERTVAVTEAPHAVEEDKVCPKTYEQHQMVTKDSIIAKFISKNYSWFEKFTDILSNNVTTERFSVVCPYHV